MEHKKKRILIVDDDKFLLDMYSVKFQENGYDVASASSGDSALEMLRSAAVPSDVVLLDLVMPGTDGFELLRIIRSESAIARTPCIVLSNLGEGADIERALKLGANSYIVKASHTPSEVVQKVSDILSPKAA